MNIKELQKNMMDALKNGNKEEKNVLSSIINTAKNAAILKKMKDNISDEIISESILKELKTIQEQIDTCPADRTDLIELFQLRKSIVEKYAPKMMSEEEIRTILERDFHDVLNSKNKGMIMKEIMPVLKGKADGKLINAIISEYLK